MILFATLLVAIGSILLVLNLSTESAFINKYPKGAKIGTKAKSFILIVGIAFLLVGTYLLIDTIK